MGASWRMPPPLAGASSGVNKPGAARRGADSADSADSVDEAGKQLARPGGAVPYPPRVHHDVIVEQAHIARLPADARTPRRGKARRGKARQGEARQSGAGDSNPTCTCEGGCVCTRDASKAAPLATGTAPDNSQRRAPRAGKPTPRVSARWQATATAACLLRVAPLQVHRVVVADLSGALQLCHGNLRA